MRWALSQQAGEFSGASKSHLADQVFFKLWKVRLPLWKHLSAGDDVWLTEPAPQGRIVTWHAQVKDVVQVEIATPGDAASILQRQFGLPRKEFLANEYAKQRGDARYLLGFTVKPVEAVDLPYPASLPTMRQEGYVDLTGLSDKQLAAAGLLPGKARRPPAAPRRSPVSTLGGGRQQDPVVRQAVERYAQDAVEDHFRRLGWKVTDTHATAAWDAEARRGRKVLFLEAKGLTGTKAEVEVTIGEVEHARANPTTTVLGIVCGIKVTKAVDGTPTASGGTLHLVRNWDPDAGSLKPLTFRHKPGQMSDPTHEAYPL